MPDQAFFFGAKNPQMTSRTIASTMAPINPARPGGVRAGLCPHASRGEQALGSAQTSPELTFEPDHPVGADHSLIIQVVDTLLIVLVCALSR